MPDKISRAHVSIITEYLERAISSNPELSLRRVSSNGSITLLCGNIEVVEFVPGRDYLFSVADLMTMLRNTRRQGPSAVNALGGGYTSWVTSESQVVSETAKRLHSSIEVLKADFPELRALGLV